MKRRTFEFRFRHDPKIDAPTEIFLPEVQYPDGCKVEVSDGRYEVRSEEQKLVYWHSEEREEHTIRLRMGESFD